MQAEGANYAQSAYQSFTYGTATLKILTGHEYWEDINNYSVVCRLDTGDIEFLFMGDAESPVESNLYEDLSAEVLKVGHHGSTSSTSDSFLARVNPKAAIISVGADNDYGHPSNEVLTRLQSAGAKIYRTDEQGTITVTVTTDGGTYSINTEPSTSISASVIPVVKSTKYIGNKNSKKFHRSTCSSLPIPSNQVIFNSREAAISAGYVACKKCNP